jgi:hypothetical protein
MGKPLIVLVLIAAFWPVAAWDLMIVAGVVHRDWWPSVPPMGVGAAFAIGGFTTLFGLLIGVITAVIRAVSGASD